MRAFLILVALTLFCLMSFAQMTQADFFGKDSLIIVRSDPEKGFHHDYILFIPKGTRLNRKTFLLVEPNNTGKLSDSINIHLEHAIYLASVSSVGNNISTELKIPLLVPVFPRPASVPLTYTHALDRDVMLEDSPALKRIDLQLLKMIDDANIVLKRHQICLEEKILMNGFSASATFTNRFSFIHPQKIKALAMGGFNGVLILPIRDLKGNQLDYPLGIHDFHELFGQPFNVEAYRSIPQFIYMGKLDENDAVQFDDAYSEKERKIINGHIGATVQERYTECQKMYQQSTFNTTFRTLDDVGHWTTSGVNLEVILFFLGQIKEKQN